MIRRLVQKKPPELTEWRSVVELMRLPPEKQPRLKLLVGEQERHPLQQARRPAWGARLVWVAPAFPA